MRHATHCSLCHRERGVMELLHGDGSGTGTCVDKGECRRYCSTRIKCLEADRDNLNASWQAARNLQLAAEERAEDAERALMKLIREGASLPPAPRSEGESNA